MCGIVGILGTGPVAPLIVDALKRLEYRGYDSAGVATLEDGHLARRRAEGKLRNLEVRLNEQPLQGLVGIGHTRWATHGRPTERNAHPHATDKLAVVHNGIIENFRELRQMLEGEGIRFETETDTEVVAQLVSREMSRVNDPVRAVTETLPRLRGAFALAFLFDGEEDLLIGARQGAPLAVGYGDDEMYLGSDALALAPFTDTITYLEDGDWVILHRDGASFRDVNNREVERKRQKTTAGAFVMDKGNHRHFMAKEIHEQPEVVGRTLAHYLDMGTGRIRLPFDLPFDWTKLDRMTISACGTAYYAGLVGKYWFERFARIPVEIDIASEFRYREAPMASARPRTLHLPVGRDRRHAWRPALRQGAGPARHVGGQRADAPPSRGRATSWRRHWPARRSASPRRRRSRASSPCWPASPSRPAWPAAH